MMKLLYKVSRLQAYNTGVAGETVIHEISWFLNKGFYKNGNRAIRNLQKYVSPFSSFFLIPSLVAPAFYLTRARYWFFEWADVVGVGVGDICDFGGIFISMTISENIWILWNKPFFAEVRRQSQISLLDFVRKLTLRCPLGLLYKSYIKTALNLLKSD